MTDNNELLSMQAEFKKGNTAVLSAMYKKLYEIAYKIINNRSCQNENIASMTAAERKQKAHDAATYLIEQYLKRPAFVISDSITGYLYRRINWELYGKDHQYKRDKMVVYTDKLPERNGARKKYKYLVKDIITGIDTTYESAAELYLNPAFKCLRKKRLAECIRTGRKWKIYSFDIMEVEE